MIKNRTWFQNNENYQNLAGGGDGLNYNTAPIGELVGQDTDADGVLDWEEALWGTDPFKRDTDGDGVTDDVAIEKLKKENATAGNLKIDAGADDSANLTQTDQFSRELFATVVSLSQNGSLDDATVEKLGGDLAEKIQSPVQRKVFTLSDLKISKDDSKIAIQKYADTLRNLYPSTPLKYNVLDVLQKFVDTENNGEDGSLSGLDPIIGRNTKLVDDMSKMIVPQSLAQNHLDLLNDFEKILENLSDMRLYATDPIVALGGMQQYADSAGAMQEANQKLAQMINQKLIY